MRRLALLVPVVLAGSLALAGCSGGGPAGQAAGKSPGSAPSTQPTSSAHGTSGKVVNPATVVDGMHYVQLFGTVDPVLTQMAAAGGTVPTAAELRNAARSLRQFAAQARGLPSTGSGGQTLDQLATASSTLAGQLTSLAAKGSPSSDSPGLDSALARFHSAAAAARRAAGLPAIVTPRTPKADTGP